MPSKPQQNKVLVDKSRSTTLHLTGILFLILYFVAGAIYSINLTTETRFKDEREYLALSDYLLHGPGYSLDGVHLTALRPPGYPFFVTALKAMGGTNTCIRLAQYLLVISTILLIYRFCPKNARSTGLLVVTSLVMLYPVLFYTSATIYPQTLTAFLFILSMTLLAATPRGALLNLMTGLSFGLLILVTPTFIFTLIVALVMSKIFQIIRWRDCLYVLVAATFTIGLWTTRNAVLFHQFVPIASNSGYNLLLGNCENTVPYGGTANIDLVDYNNKAIAMGLNEFQMDHYYQKAAINWIEHHRLSAIALYFEKVLNFFNVWNEYSPLNSSEIVPWKQLVMAFTYMMLLALLIWRLLERNRFPLIPLEKLFLAVYVLSAFTSAIFVTRIRYRLPYDYLIIAIIAIHLNNRIQAWLETSSRKNETP